MLRIIDEKNEKTLHEKVLKMNFTINSIANCSSSPYFFYKFVTLKIILTTQKTIRLMSKGIYKLPEIKNEPVKSYAPGSPERKL